METVTLKAQSKQIKKTNKKKCKWIENALRKKTGLQKILHNVILKVEINNGFSILCLYKMTFQEYI